MHFSVEEVLMNRNLGEYFRDEREKKNITIEQVSSKTKIRPDFIKALEEENYDVLPKEPFVSGFIKNYAIFLDINPEEVYEIYLSNKKERVPQENVLSIEKVTKEKKKKAQINYFFILYVLLGVCVSAVLIYYAFTYIEFIKDRKKYDNIVEQKVVEQKAEEQVQSQYEKLKQTSVVRPIIADKLEMVLECSDDCWVRVSSDGMKIFEEILRRKEIRKFNAKDNLEIKIGNVYGLKLTLNGKVIDIMKGSSQGVNTLKFDNNSLGNMKLRGMDEYSK
jgi:cytoskeletal protein RodZ